MVWFSFLIFVVRFQPADRLAAAEAKADGDAEEAEDEEQKRGAGAFASAEQAAEKAFGCLHCHERLEGGIYERAIKEIPKRNGQPAEHRAHAPHAERIGTEQNEYADGAERRAALFIRPNDERKACHRAAERGKRLRRPQAQK